MGMLDRLRISQRLLAITVAFTLPIGVMLWLIVSNINHDIAFSQLELQGNAYQRPLEHVLEALADHQRLGTEYLGGTAALKSNVADAAKKVDAAFEELRAAQAELGEGLQFTPEGLAMRKRDHVSVANVQREWHEVDAGGDRLSREQFVERHTHLAADVRTMITHVGDTSNLILDPDLDSYYTMDMTLIALPQTESRGASVIALVQDLAARHAINEAEQIQLAVAAAAFKESDRDRLVADADTALNEDKNFQGPSESLQRKLPPAVASYVAATNTFIDAISAAVKAPERADFQGMVSAGTKAQDASFALSSVAADELDVLLRARVDEQRLSRFWALILSGLAWAGSLAFVFVVSRSITRPLGGISADLTTSARQVASASGQVAMSSQSLSQGATEQAASLEETSASMEEMASMTRQNAENSQSAADLMAEVDGRVKESNVALTDMVASMASIQESSQQVAKIIKTIDEIAFQTNILALNAAVEAARAGEAGMGFAVVADEVRSLAQRSATAARDTTGLIEASIARARSGNVKVEQVAASIAGITDSVGKVKGLVEEVSVASRQQTQGIDQVSQAISQMEKVTQTTAATAEESAAASEELSAQAEGSMAVVARLEALVGGKAEATTHRRPAAKQPAPQRLAPVVRMPHVARSARRSPKNALPTGDGTFGKL